jgi:aspartate 1-decarboxylase
MILTFLKTKIHRATVTQTDIDYNGSISIDKNLMEAAGIYEYERVEVYNINNGQRFNTYAIEAPAGSKMIGINGAAARLVQKNDLVIICAYAMIDEKELKEKKEPTVILVDKNNDITN